MPVSYKVNFIFLHVADTHMDYTTTFIHRACQNFKKTYDSIALQFSKEYPEVDVYAVSCAVHKDLCNKHNVAGFPVSVPTSIFSPVLLGQIFFDIFPLFIY